MRELVDKSQRRHGVGASASDNWCHVITRRTDLKTKIGLLELGMGCKSWPLNCNSQLKKGTRINVACHCNPSNRDCWDDFPFTDATLLLEQATCRTKTEYMSLELFFQEIYKRRDCLTKVESVRDGEMVTEWPLAIDYLLIVISTSTHNYSVTVEEISFQNIKQSNQSYIVVTFKSVQR